MTSSAGSLIRPLGQLFHQSPALYKSFARQCCKLAYCCAAYAGALLVLFQVCGERRHHTPRTSFQVGLHKKTSALFVNKRFAKNLKQLWNIHYMARYILVKPHPKPTLVTSGNFQLGSNKIQ